MTTKIGEGLTQIIPQIPQNGTRGEEEIKQTASKALEKLTQNTNTSPLSKEQMQSRISSVTNDFISAVNKAELAKRKILAHCKNPFDLDNSHNEEVARNQYLTATQVLLVVSQNVEKLIDQVTPENRDQIINLRNAINDYRFNFSEKFGEICHTSMS